MSPVERLEHAFSIAKNHLGIDKLLDSEGGISLFYLIRSFFWALLNKIPSIDIYDDYKFQHFCAVIFCFKPLNLGLKECNL